MDKSAEKYAVIDRESIDLPQSGAQKTEITIEGSNLTDPTLVFVPFIDQSDGRVVFAQQKPTGKPLPKYDAEYWPYNLWTDTISPKRRTRNKLIPPAVDKALTFFKVKGLFGVSLVDSEQNSVNGVIFLIEWCDQSKVEGNAAHTPEKTDLCSGQVVYSYCATPESDHDPMKTVRNRFCT